MENRKVQTEGSEGQGQTAPRSADRTRLSWAHRVVHDLLAPCQVCSLCVRREMLPVSLLPSGTLRTGRPRQCVSSPTLRNRHRVASSSACVLSCAEAAEGPHSLCVTGSCSPPAPPSALLHPCCLLSLTRSLRMAVGPCGYSGTLLGRPSPRP